MKKMMFQCDNDGRWYFLPLSLVDKFNDWVNDGETEECFEDENGNEVCYMLALYDTDFDEFRINGDPELYVINADEDLMRQIRHANQIRLKPEKEFDKK